MFALNRYALATNNIEYQKHAIVLAKTAYKAFVYSRPMGFRMYWKMNIQLTHPLVRSQGNLDPYDGLLTYSLLEMTNRHFLQKTTQESQSLSNELSLKQEMKCFETMVNSLYHGYYSSDPLDLGEALWLSHFFASDQSSAQLTNAVDANTDIDIVHMNAKWSKHLFDVSLSTLISMKSNFTSWPSFKRLAFRDFGSALGLTCAGIELQHHPDHRLSHTAFELADEIIKFWTNQSCPYYFRWWSQNIQEKMVSNASSSSSSLTSSASETSIQKLEQVQDIPTFDPKDIQKVCYRDKDISPVMLASAILPHCWLKTSYAKLILQSLKSK
jgi:hypothetical protein